MKNEKIEIELQTTRTEKPGKDQAARIEFYTQQRRIEFGKIDILPTAQKKLAFGDDQRFRRAHHAALYVAIAVAFVVTELRELRKDGIHGKIDVLCDELVGVLVDGDGSGGVRAVDEANALFNAAFTNEFVDFIRYIIKTGTVRFQVKRK